MRVELDQVSKRFEQRAVLRGVSVVIEPGERIALVGPNGSGKSTLLRLASRVVDPRAGRVTLDERSLRDYSRREIARKLAVVPQEGMIQFPFTVTEVVLMGRTPHGHGNIFESERDHAVAREAMNRLNSSCVIDFGELEYISSAGLGMLLGIQKRLGESGNKLSLINMNRHIREIFRMAGFDHIFDIQ